MSDKVLDVQEQPDVWPPPPTTEDTALATAIARRANGFPFGCVVEHRLDGSLRVAEDRVLRDRRKETIRGIAVLVNGSLLITMVVRGIVALVTHSSTELRMEFSDSWGAWAIWGLSGVMLLVGALVPTACFSWTEWIASRDSLECRQWFGEKPWRIRRWTGGQWRLINVPSKNDNNTYWELTFQGKRRWGRMWIGDDTDMSRDQLHNLGELLAAHTEWPLCASEAK